MKPSIKKIAAFIAGAIAESDPPMQTAQAEEVRGIATTMMASNRARQ
ncbi:MAG: hypothetical protein WCD79_16335 [Chthoniobacteraceae bacterium]